MSATPRPDLLDIEEAAEYLHVSVRWVRGAIAHRRIAFIKVGQLVRFDRKVLDAYLAERVVEAEER